MRKKQYDFWILILVLLLLLIGIIMVFSASAAYSYIRYKDAYLFLKKQLIYGVLGIITMLFFSKIDYRRLSIISPLMLFASIIMLGLVLVPGIGSEVNESRRWFDFGFSSFQPSEFAKISVILFYSYMLSQEDKRDKLNNFFTGLMPYLLLIGVFGGLLMLEPHLSGTILIACVASIILFCAGAKIWHFLMLFPPAAIAVLVLIKTSEYRLARLTSFLDPFEDPTGSSWQVINSLYAIGSGGVFGRGLGRGVQKFLYIPEPHNDFIFAVLAEELGFVGCVFVLILFTLLIWRGIKVAMNAKDALGCLTASGITGLIAVQVIINVAVVTSSVPVTGMPLPFISAGGTSLIFLMMAMGILLNISRHSDYEKI